MAIDVHVHCKGGEEGEKILPAMDELGLERIVLMSAPPHYSLATEQGEIRGHREVIDEIARVVRPDPDRMLGFAWIEPTLPDAEEMIDYALAEKSMVGIKMIPNQWYPDDERAQRCYQKIAGHEKPMLFHSGILWSQGNTSKYCRPAEFEIMMDYPKIRFAGHVQHPFLDHSQGVKGHQVRHLPPGLRPFADLPRDPIVAVNQVVRETAGSSKVLQAGKKPLQPVVHSGFG